MKKQMNTTECLLYQCARYPALQAQDLLKALYQGVFGPGHFVTDEAKCAALLSRELSDRSLQTDVEPLSETHFRLHLGYLKKNGLAPRTLLRLFLLSAQRAGGTVEDLETRLTILQTLARERQLSVSEASVSEAIAAWRNAGYPACHHSETFRTLYHPAYRVIRLEFFRILPLLAAIDRCLTEKGRAVVALEGGAGSGKTTLAALLQSIYYCSVFHMDDYFLRPEQRTQARLAAPGGNVDYERFYKEILSPLATGNLICCRRYDCQTQTLQSPVQITPKALTIVEGAYSMHPALAKNYDLSAFLRIDPAEQRKRIQLRNGAEMAERFFSEWIPLEQLYFDALQVQQRCDLTLEVDAHESCGD